MKEQLISFETAKLAKEKGFNLDCNSYYESSNYLTNQNKGDNWNQYKLQSAPTQSLLQKWLREEHEIDIWVERYNSERFYYQCPKVHEMSIIKNIRLDHWGDKYEEALEKGLQEALKLI